LISFVTITLLYLRSASTTRLKDLVFLRGMGFSPLRYYCWFRTRRAVDA
jgi:hypothetical protein